MTPRDILFERYKALDALVTDSNTFSEPLYSLRMHAYCDYLLSDPYFDYAEFIRVTYGPQFARLPLLPAACPTPQPAPVKEAGRIEGVIGYACAKYGYISVAGGDDVKFFPRHVFGRFPMRGDKVTFTQGVMGNALDVVLSDATTSREAYSAKRTQRLTAAPVRRGRANFGEGFQFTENPDELKMARERVKKLWGGE